jgi:hypothetical protein
MHEEEPVGVVFLLDASMPAIQIEVRLMTGKPGKSRRVFAAEDREREGAEHIRVHRRVLGQRRVHLDEATPTSSFSLAQLASSGHSGSDGRRRRAGAFSGKAGRIGLSSAGMKASAAALEEASSVHQDFSKRMSIRRSMARGRDAPRSSRRQE